MTHTVRTLFAILAIGLPLGARAGFTVPSSVHTVSELAEAVAEAEEKGRPLTFVLSDKNTTCPLCADSTETIMDGLRSKTEVVYVSTGGGEIRALPERVRQALYSPEAGNYIPKAVVIDTKYSDVVSVIPYARGSAQKDRVHDAKRKISKYVSETQSTASPRKTLQRGTVPLTEDSDRELRTWTSAQGHTLEASLFGERGAYIVLRSKDGRTLKILGNQLSKADRAYIHEVRESLRDTP